VVPIRTARIVNAPVLIEAPPRAVSAGWYRALPLFVVGLVLCLLFDSEVVAAVRTWNDSTAYNHCFLVIPIALYLLFDRRGALACVPWQLMPAASLLAVPLAMVWLVSERLGIMEGRQLAAVSFVEVAVLAMLGRRLWWAMAGPLLYLYFLVPFGEFLTPDLQGITTFFIRHGLEILGVPSYIDGFVIEIPQGTFFVAEACAGLRFLIASTAFGCLYALLMYRSPLRRGVYILISILVPIIANGFRAIGIVYLGHILGSAEAAAADHLIYGWIFFSLVILLLIALGLPFREDEVSTGSTSRFAEERAPAVSLRRVFPVVAGIAILAAVGPVVAAGLTMAAATAVVTPFRIEVGPDCEVQPVASDEGAGVRRQRVLCGAVPLDMSWEAFSPRSTAAPLMSARRKMVAGVRTEGIQENWLDQSDGTFNAWRVMESNDPAYVVAASVWIDGRPVRPGLGMRARMALNSLIGSGYAPMVVTVMPVVDWQAGNGSELKAAEDGLSHFLLNHPGLDETVGALSILR
jgi:exosortase A